MVHLLGVLIQRRDAKLLPDGFPPLIVVFGNGDDLSSVEQAIELSVFLTHPAAADDGYSQLFVSHVPSESVRFVPSSDHG